MKVLLIGLGSIARKHLAALAKIAPAATSYALRRAKRTDCVAGVKNIYSYVDVPADIDFTIISNPTHLHLETLEKVISFGKPVFLEKPPLSELSRAEEILNKVRKQGIPLYTAFNLRFHPIIQWAKVHLDPSEILEVQAYCGSYLPDWRPSQDYRHSYSAKSEMGGGVHLDLIHELDYLKYLFGIPKRVFRFLDSVSPLEINSVDSAQYRLEYGGFNANVLLNYFRRIPKRSLEVVTVDDVLYLDLLAFTVTNGAGKRLYQTTPNFLQTYQDQMSYFLDHIKSGAPMMNSLAESLETLKICLHEGEE